MTDYKKLVEDLKQGVGHWYRKDPARLVAMFADAAAAIEDLQKGLTTLQKCYEIADTTVDEVLKQLPKRGEWIKHPEVKNIYGGVYIECPFCGEKYVVQNVSDEKFCRNCGADLRAKTEVQE